MCTPDLLRCEGNFWSSCAVCHLCFSSTVIAFNRCKVCVGANTVVSRVRPKGRTAARDTQPSHGRFASVSLSAGTCYKQEQTREKSPRSRIILDTTRHPHPSTTTQGQLQKTHLEYDTQLCHMHTRTFAGEGLNAPPRCRSSPLAKCGDSR